jgi:uroporphyrinogen III methyltransferase/synthase
VRNFIACLEAEGIDVPRFMASTAIASIGPVTTEALRKRGFEADVEASPYTVAALADALGEYFGLAAPE